MKTQKNGKRHLVESGRACFNPGTGSVGAPGLHFSIFGTRPHMRDTKLRALRILALLAVATLAAWSAPVATAEDEAISGDLKKMQGTWVKDGEEGPDVKWTIKGDKLDVEVAGMEFKCKLVLDSKATPFPTADLEIKDGPGDAAGKTSKAIYKFDGEKLVFCVTHPGIESRPTEFKPIEDQALIFTLKKEK
jgi:uncharacterized protein (TIGR03067 family)